jgi:predicted transposase/invertase (TIGR01784 family)
MERYINPFTDFGFKKLFGEEANKDLLIDFLNQLIGSETGLITSLTYLRNEHIGSAQEDRKAIFDLYCENQKGEKFIVELQKARQKFFKDRSLYYSTFAIQEQAITGEWDFKLQRVYTVSIMDFEFDETQANRQKFIHDICLIDRETNEIFSDKLRYIYLEMPKFLKREDELETQFDKWLYVLRNLADLQEIPARIQERIFRRLFDAAELARYSPDDRRAYHSSLKYYRDIKNVIDTAFEQGIEKGIEEGREQERFDMARLMKAADEPTDKITRFTGLSADEIAKL